MRRSIKICVSGLIIIGLMLAVFARPSVAAVKAVKDSTWTAWPNTIYYLARLAGPKKPYVDVKIHITAIDKYILYVNGVRVDDASNDGDWHTVETYTVTISGSDMVLAVAVTNNGLGDGNGLMIDIEAGGDRLGTTTLQRMSAKVGGTMLSYPDLSVKWYYYDSNIVDLLGQDWYKLNYNAAKHTTSLDDANIVSNLKEVLSGEFKGEINFIPNEKIEIITGYHKNVDLGRAVGGGIQLRGIEGQNLALKKPAEFDKITDGDTIASFYGYNQDPLGATGWIDLEKIYRVNRMIIFTGGSNPNDWEKKSVRGYAIDVSIDKFRWEEVGVIHEIGVLNRDQGGFDYGINDFPDEWARYVRYRITESRIDYPNVGEVMVYGIGHIYDGEYESPWIDFGTPAKLKNFQKVVLEGDIPDGTSIKFQTRSAYMDPKGTPVQSTWSNEYDLKDMTQTFPFASPEPASMIQYRVKLATQDIHRTPVLKSLTFSYSEQDQPVITAAGFVRPNNVPMGVDTTFVYTLSYELNPGEDLDQVVLYTPGYASVNYIYSSDTGTTLKLDDGFTYPHSPTPDSLYIKFDTPILNTTGTGSDSLYISFESKLLRTVHNFYGMLYNSKMNDNAGGVQIWENKDMGSWTVVTSSIIKGVLSDVKAIPKVFTPNGDNTNDFTVIEFNLSKIRTDLKIKIFDTKGSLVTTVYDDKLDPGPWFVKDKFGNDALARRMPGYWDGTDEDGDLVPPGVYLYQVIADTDEGAKVESGSVVVGY